MCGYLSINIWIFVTFSSIEVVFILFYYMKIFGLIFRTNKAKNGNGNVAEEEENEGLAMLIPNIQETAKIVKIAAERLQKLTGTYN